MPLTRKRLLYDSRRWTDQDGPVPEPGLEPLSTDTVFMTMDRYPRVDGREVIHAQQYYRGLRVHGSTRVVTRSQGKLVRATPALFVLPAHIDIRPSVSPVDAVGSIASFLKRRKRLSRGINLKTATVRRNLELVEQPTLIDGATGVQETIRLHLEVFPEPGGRARVAWVAALALSDGRLFTAVVGARGRPRLLAITQMDTCAFDADWRPLPDVQETASCPMPVLDVPPGGAGIVSQWSFDEATAAGANVEVYDSGSINADPLGPITTDNPFVWCNVLHDFFAAYGFDDAHHAFSGIDPLIVVRRNGKNKAAGQFQYRKDGDHPEVRLFATTHANGVHAAADPTVVIHEYVHGVTSRLVGGSAVTTPFTTIETQGISEGLSDYFALTILGLVARRRGQAEPRVFGARFQPGGMRSYAQFNKTMPQPQDIYKIGMVWAAALFDGRLAVVSHLGVGSDDRADRFIWLACIQGLITVGPDPAKKVITGTTMKRALLDSAALIEQQDATLTWAQAALASGFTARNIA